MLTKEEIDALKAHKFEPYTDEEYARHVVNPECRLRANIERVHYHNQDLSLLVDNWRDYLDGHRPKPKTSLLLALMPGHGGANDARDTLGFIADFYAKNPHGSVKTWPCLIFMSKTCMTLLQHLRALHTTPHLSGAERHIKDFINLITYEGEPIMRQDEFAEKLYAAENSFFSACERNAIALSQWLDSPKEKSAPLSQRRDLVRMRALERMQELYDDGMTWTEAEEQTHHEMWREFESLGLACAPHNFHRLRYNR